MSQTPGMSVFYDTFTDIIRMIHTCARVEDIAEFVLAKTSRAFEAQGALFQLYQRQNGKSVTNVVQGLGEIYRQAGPFKGLDQALDLCTGQKVVVLDANRDPRLIPASAGTSYQVLVAAPLDLQGKMVGFLGLMFQHPREFAPEDLDFLSAVAQQCTCAIDKVKLIERQQLQFDQLAHQTERLTALGRMASGVAHELNNPLSSILLYSSNMLKKVPPGEFLHEGLEIIIQETKRCKTIIQELQEFSRSKEPKKIVGNINRVLEKVIRLLENEFRRRSIRLHQKLAADIPKMFIDIGQMQQIFANLLINASEAVNSKGEISVSTRSDQSGQAVIIEVADTGCGIPKEHLERIYEPFFSTKPRGTGLGLAVTYGFIMNHQGDIQVESEPGRGTRFTISIPVASPELGTLRTNS